MISVGRAIVLPIVMVWALLRLLALPAAAVAVAWLVTDPGSSARAWTLLVAVGYGALVVRLWWIGQRGRLRSVARGSIHLGGSVGRRGGDR